MRFLHRQKVYFCFTLWLFWLGGIFPAQAKSSWEKNFLKGYAAFNQQKFKEAIRYYENLLKKPHLLQDYVLYYLAESHAALKKCEIAAMYWQRLKETKPDSLWLTLVTPEEWPLCGTHMGHRKKPLCSEYHADAGKADCHFEQKSYDQAQPLYLKLAEQTQGVERLHFLQKASSSAARNGQNNLAISLNNRIIQVALKPKEIQAAFKRNAFLYFDSGQYEKALGLYRDLLKTAFGKERHGVLENMAWAAYKLGHWALAQQYWEQLLRLRPDTGTQAKVAYWKARVLLKQGKDREAKTALNLLMQKHPRSYYGFLSLKKLYGDDYPKKARHLWNPDKSRQRMSTAALEKGIHPLDLSRAIKLTALNLKAEAVLEINTLAKNCTRKCDWAKLIHWATKNGSHGLAYQKPLFHRGNEWSWMYPKIHPQQVEKLARKHSLSTHLIYALIKQESTYREWILSPAGAVGLMQLMPYTAEALAQELNLKHFHPGQLTHPYINLNLGVYYLRKLATEFGDHAYVSILASYNAGEHRTRRWRQERPHGDEEEFTEEIPFSETRNYVKKVLINLEMYRLLYP